MSVVAVLEELSRRGARLALEDDRLTLTAPEGVLDPGLTALVRRHRAEVVQFLREQAEEEARRLLRIKRVERDGPLPASYAQQRLWLIEQLGTDFPVYNMYFTTELNGPLDEEALRWAAGELMARHEVLRTALRNSPAGLVQEISAHCPAPFFEHDAPTDAQAEDLIRQVTETRFDLAVAPLIRFDLIRCAPERWIFVVTQHHVISDGWSTGLIRSELSELYAARVAGRPADLPEVTVQYADFAAWEREWLGTELAERQRAFWRGQLAELPPLLDPAPGRTREAVQGFRGDALDFRLGPEAAAALERLCALAAGTPYSVFMGVFTLLLARISRTDDIAVGSPLANRPYAALERTLGLFFNSISVRTVVRPEETVRDYLARVRRTAFDAFAHQDLPFDQVVEAVAPERSSSHSPIFQSIFIYQSYPDGDLDLPGIRTGPAPAPVYAAQYDLMLKLRQESDGFLGQLLFSTVLFDQAQARLLVTWFERLLTGMAEDPDRPVGELPLISPEEEARQACFDAEAELAMERRPVHRLVLQRLAEEGDRQLVSFRGRSLTGAQLAERSAAVAGALRAAGLRPGDRVGLLVPRSPDLVVVLLGVLAAGLAYVPLGTTDPQGRLEGMLADAQCAALITDDPYRQLCPGFTGRRLALTDLVSSSGRADGMAPALAEPGPEDSAYVIFTSGSTGRPKGVEVTHGNLANLFTALDHAVELPADARWLAVTAITFDIALVELLWTLSQGVPVVMAENGETLALADPDQAAESVPELIARTGVTALQATPTLLRSVLRLPGGSQALSRLRLVLCGGEPLEAALAARLKDLGIPRVLNLYGPTETTIWSTVWEVPDDPATVFVGRPLANTRVRILDAGLRPVPDGMFGELAIAGAGVAKGYLTAPELTAARFVRAAGEERLYRTGDLARRLPDGTLELTGRLDHQVKVNGYRIELVEVERALDSLPEIAACAVVVQKTDDGQALVAHYVTEDGRDRHPRELRSALAAVLPQPYVPAAFNHLPALPTTSGGKTDRRALPTVALASGASPGPDAPQPADELESLLLAAWRRVLERPLTSLDDDFFQAGGNSILVARLLTEIRAHVTAEARIVDLFRYPTVRSYAAHLRGSTASPAPADDVPAPAAARAVGARRRAQVLRKRRLHERLGPAPTDPAPDNSPGPAPGTAPGGQP
ncbi:amino acid adenylation domain-containing protein [Streptomyces sp. N2A]|uniref:non-ribosomal peptide synthetase n=1 Tax=Streptomyces sp. N2A TaxID=3073936 RepID=UPI00287077FA|nr:amino acid adenylation domain-containing protein [Streptomyces sp. N2A]